MNIKNNCKRSTLLVEKKLLGPITLPDAVFLQLHLFGCLECRIYKKQSYQIDSMVKKLYQASSSNVVMLNDFFKHQLQNAIKARIEEDPI